MSKELEPRAGAAEKSTERLSYKFQRLRERIRAAIESGELAGKLPGERQLARRFKVNAKTLSKALTDLAAEGVLERSIGLGTFVRQSRRDPSDADPAGPASDTPATSVARILLLIDPRDADGPLRQALAQRCGQLQVVTDAAELRPSLLAQHKYAVQASPEAPDAVVRDWVVRGMTVVRIEQEPSHLSTHAVLVDRQWAVTCCLRLLARQGRRRIAVIDSAHAPARLSKLAGELAPMLPEPPAVVACTLGELAELLGDTTVQDSGIVVNVDAEVKGNSRGGITVAGAAAPVVAGGAGVGARIDVGGVDGSVGDGSVVGGSVVGGPVVGGPVVGGSGVGGSVVGGSVIGGSGVGGLADGGSSGGRAAGDAAARLWVEILGGAFDGVICDAAMIDDVRRVIARATQPGGPEDKPADTRELRRDQNAQEQGRSLVGMAGGRFARGDSDAGTVAPPPADVHDHHYGHDDDPDRVRRGAGAHQPPGDILGDPNWGTPVPDDHPLGNAAPDSGRSNGERSNGDAPDWHALERDARADDAGGNASDDCVTGPTGGRAAVAVMGVGCVVAHPPATSGHFVLVSELADAVIHLLTHGAPRRPTVMYLAGACLDAERRRD